MSVLTVLSVWKEKLTIMTKLTEQKMHETIETIGGESLNCLKNLMQIFIVLGSTFDVLFFMCNNW